MAFSFTIHNTMRIKPTKLRLWHALVFCNFRRWLMRTEKLLLSTRIIQKGRRLNTLGSDWGPAMATHFLSHQNTHHTKSNKNAKYCWQSLCKAGGLPHSNVQSQGKLFLHPAIQSWSAPWAPCLPLWSGEADGSPGLEHKFRLDHPEKCFLGTNRKKKIKIIRF